MAVQEKKAILRSKNQTKIEFVKTPDLNNGCQSEATRLMASGLLGIFVCVAYYTIIVVAKFTMVNLFPFDKAEVDEKSAISKLSCQVSTPGTYWQKKC